MFTKLFFKYSRLSSNYGINFLFSYNNIFEENDPCIQKILALAFSGKSLRDVKYSLFDCIIGIRFVIIEHYFISE